MRGRGKHKGQALKRGRADQPHNVELARVHLQTAIHLRNATVSGIAAAWNLKPATAHLLLRQEQENRGA